MTNRSTSNSAMVTLPGFYFLTRFLHANRYPLRSKTILFFDAFSTREPVPTSLENAIEKSDLLAAFAHLGAELCVDRFGKILRPLVHIGHAELDCPGLRRE